VALPDDLQATRPGYGPGRPPRNERRRYPGVECRIGRQAVLRAGAAQRAFLFRYYRKAGPKRLARVLRLERALVAARGGEVLALAAATAGYADQAHFAHQCRALAGVSPTTLLH
jgi:methylphosphotriester-DNA--protein-cysteine methyltransferase